jgi:protein TonB
MVSIVIHALILGASGIMLSRPAEYGVTGALASIAHRRNIAIPSREPVEFIGDPYESSLRDERDVGPHSRPSPPSEQDPSASAGAYEIPSYYRNPAPPYPEEARQLKQEGEVMLRVEVDGEGRAVGISVLKSSGVLSLDESALTTVKGWRFKPGRIAGIAIATHVIVPVSFRLNDVR